jgi:hypothetical protein
MSRKYDFVKDELISQRNENTVHKQCPIAVFKTLFHEYRLKYFVLFCIMLAVSITVFALIIIDIFLQMKYINIIILACVISNLIIVYFVSAKPKHRMVKSKNFDGYNSKKKKSNDELVAKIYKSLEKYDIITLEAVTELQHECSLILSKKNKPSFPKIESLISKILIITPAGAIIGYAVNPEDFIAIERIFFIFLLGVIAVIAINFLNKFIQKADRVSDDEYIYCCLQEVKYYLLNEEKYPEIDKL